MQWEKNGAKGWGWDNLKPFFEKASGAYPVQGKVLDQSVSLPHYKFSIILSLTFLQVIDCEGPLKTSYPPTNAISQAFVDSGVSL